MRVAVTGAGGQLGAALVHEFRSGAHDVVALGHQALEVTDDALPDYAAVTVADGTTLLMNIANDTVFMGSIEGEMGELVKRGSASLTLGGDIVLGGLTIDAGKIQVGTGLSENIVSFDYAIVEQGATLYVASGATLTIVAER